MSLWHHVIGVMYLWDICVPPLKKGLCPDFISPIAGMSRKGLQHLNMSKEKQVEGRLRCCYSLFMSSIHTAPWYVWEQSYT